MKQKNIVSTLRHRKTEDIKTIASLNAINMLTAKDAMIAPVFLNEHDDIITILKKLKHEDIQACIVVTKNKKFVGEISVEDIIKLFLQQINTEPMVRYLTRGYKTGLLYANAGELCNKHTYTVSPNTNINAVIRYIYTPKCLYVPVIDQQKKVIGVITPNSLINLLKDY